MVKIKMHALYDHFPDRKPKEGEKYIDFYCDTYVKECKGSSCSVAMLLEPKSMIGDAYRYVREHSGYFKYIFTHDSDLLKLENARMLNWADVWLTADKPKTKGISICTSYKNWCPLHDIRLEIAKHYKDSKDVDVFFGDWNNPKIPTVKAEDYLEKYRFSIVIENDIDEYWFTEKILNCFSTKTIPIYIGASEIGEMFNTEGIIRVTDWRNIPWIIDSLDIEREYEKRLAAVNDNFKRVEEWKTPWKERFFRNYEELLEGLLNE